NLTCEQRHRVESPIAEFKGGENIEDSGTELGANPLCLRHDGRGTAEHDLTEFHAVGEFSMASRPAALSGVVGAIITGAGNSRFKRLVREYGISALAPGVARFKVGSGLLVA